MKTIQMTLNEKLLESVDEATKKLKTTRSALIRESLKIYLEKLRIEELERKHREGYLDHPVKKGEFDMWEDEQVWC